MKAVSLITTLALAATLFAYQDTSKAELRRTYTKDETHRYVVSADKGGRTFEATLEAKVKSLEAGKPVDVELKTLKFAVPGNGIVPGPETVSYKFDANGMPHTLETNDNRAIYVIYAVCSYLPSKSVGLQEEFAIHWAGKDSGGTLDGKGRLVAIKQVGDRSIGSIRSHFTAQPAGESEQAVVDLDADFDLKTGALISAKGSGTLYGEDIQISVKEAK